MTHSLHRKGDSESLKNDFVFLCTPSKGRNSKGASKKLKQILSILLTANPTNIGFYGVGSMADCLDTKAVADSLNDNSRLRCCFDERAKVEFVLEQIKEGDFGLSVVISGVIAEVLDIARGVGLTPHTINLSCGVLGNTDLLPEGPILEISTMCGHGMISHRLVSVIINKIKSGTLDVEKAVAILCKPCTCGIFNPTRARAILVGQQEANHKKPEGIDN